MTDETKPADPNGSPGGPEEAVRSRVEAEPSTTELQARFDDHVKHALLLQDESDWHDFKLGLFPPKGADGPRTPVIEELRKDIVALANTVGGPFGGSGYIIIGVKNKSWEPVGIQPNDQYPTLDQLRNAVVPMAQKTISPPVDVDVAAVHVHTSDDSPVTLHVIAVPQSPLSWHVSTAETSLGAWVRDHHASVRPLRRQHDQYLQRVVTLTTGALQRELADVQQRTIRLADDLARLTALRDPEALSAAQHVRAHFRGHDQRLQRLTRNELQMFMERVQVFHDTMDRLPLDTMLFESSVAQARRADLNECLARGEEAIKPLIELMSSLIHTVTPGPLPRRIAQEIFNVVGFTSNNAVKLPHFTFALRTYPAQLFIQAVAIATVEAEAEESWTYFRDLLARPVELPSLQGARRGYLPSHLVFRQPLNLVLALASDSSAASYPFNRRAAFLTTPGWVGDALPVLHPERRYWSGEALLTLGYCLAAGYRHATPPAIEVQWWTFTDAQRLLYETLSSLAERSSLFGHLTLLAAARRFDELSKEGHHLTEPAMAVLREVEDDLHAMARMDEEETE